MTSPLNLAKRIVAAMIALLVMAAAHVGALTTPLAAQTAEPAVSPAFVAFITESYLNAKISTAEEVGQLYGDRVGYYGDTLSRQSVIADKLRYYKRWPTRTFVLNQDSLKVTRTSVDATTANVRFEYTYSVSDGRETRKGRGVAQLQLTADEGRLVIVSENGKVLQKF